VEEGSHPGMVLDMLSALIRKGGCGVGGVAGQGNQECAPRGGSARSAWRRRDRGGGETHKSISKIKESLLRVWNQEETGIEGKGYVQQRLEVGFKYQLVNVRH